MSGGEYGRRAVLGIGTPQANPTVEPEIAALMPPGVNLLVTRLTSAIADSRDRLVDYIERLADAPASFDRLRLDAFGFACTGSSYLVGAAREAQIVDAAQAACGTPIITAAEAVRRALRHLGVKRIAIVSPYPEWLHQAGVGYWTAAGFDVAGAARIDTGDSDTRGVYGMTSGAARDAAAALDVGGAECVLLAGTGLPTLGVIAEVERACARPVVSSNLCLGWALLVEAGVDAPAPGPPGSGETLLAGWAERLRDRKS